MDDPQPRARAPIRLDQIETEQSQLRRILAEITRLLADAQELIERAHRSRH